MKKEIEKLCLMISRFLVISLFFTVPTVSAVDINTTISDAEKAQFDEVLVPVMKIYNFIKYTASLIAVIALLFAGISYMFSGNDVRKRDTSKHMIAYVLVGLAIIWAAPFVVKILIL